MRTIGSRSDRRKRERPTTGGGELWLYGLHAVAAALGNPRRRARRLVVAEGAVDALRRDLGAGWAPSPDLPVEVRSRQDLDSVLPAGAVHQGAALLVAPLPTVDIDAVAEPSGPSTLLVLDQVTDPQNVGAALRSAEAFGARAVIVQDRHAPPESAALAKAASGALERIPVVRVTNLARALDDIKDHGHWCIGLAAEAAVALATVEAGERVALVLGAEGGGLRRLTAERCDLLAAIPIAGAVGSLNVSAAAAVALYELRRRR